MALPRLLGVALVAALAYATGCEVRFEDSRPAPGDDRTRQPVNGAPHAVVERVVDGDTVVLGDGAHVRLVGMDAPEVGTCGYDRATAAVERLVLGERVRLTAPVDDTDRYGRLLRYVDVGETDVGLHLIRLGLAVARYDSRDGYDPHPREVRYVAADRESPPFTCR